MLAFILSFLTFIQLGLAKNAIDSDCKLDELKKLRSNEIVSQFAVESKLVDLDCTVIRSAKKNEKLLVLMTLNTLDGLQTFVGLFSRATLTPSSIPRFRSDALGVDSFPFVVKGHHRLLFALPEKDAEPVAFYTCTQNKDGQLNFLKRTLSEKLLTITNVDDHKWAVDAGKSPKLFSEKGQWRAIVMGKIVDL